MRFLYQSGLLAVELLARDDRVAHSAEYQPAIFLFHLESAVEIVLRDDSEDFDFCDVRGYLSGKRVALIALARMWRGVIKMIKVGRQG